MDVMGSCQCCWRWQVDVMNCQSVNTVHYVVLTECRIVITMVKNGFPSGTTVCGASLHVCVGFLSLILQLSPICFWFFSLAIFLWPDTFHISIAGMCAYIYQLCTWFSHALSFQEFLGYNYWMRTHGILKALVGADVSDLHKRWT